MELKINIDYNQVLNLIRQLPEKEISRLADILQSEVVSKKSLGSIQKFLLKAPTWADSDFEEYREARDFINKSRIV